jgi:peptidoglycan/LPS O-acetylase OafA/YrhL/CubicO group peptidase (beta-lactamase class C family)
MVANDMALQEKKITSEVGYLPGLDGLRALAVIAVMLYHADFPVFGGYLGVESFFVLSGYLITTLLLHEWQQHQRIRYGTFLLRRMRRLLPALVVLLAGVLAAALMVPGALQNVQRETLAALGYATNWYFIASEQSYFEALERPSLLQHLWSLAIEGQFYLLWPLVFAAAIRFLRHKGTVVLSMLLAAGSTVLMFTLYDPGNDPSRVYYGTDTRVAALLIGAALALVWMPGRMPKFEQPAARVALDGVGIVALAALLFAYLRLRDQDPFLYQGGLTLISLCTALLIAITIHPGARLLPWLLERAPLRWLGQRSYSLYLWHWPIFMLMRPGIDLVGNEVMIQALRFALSILLAMATYSLVEEPIRRGALSRVWQAIRRKGALVGAPLVAHGKQFWHPRQWYRRWAPTIATALVALGAAYIGVNVSHAAMLGTLLVTEQSLVSKTAKGTYGRSQSPTVSTAPTSAVAPLPTATALPSLGRLPDAEERARQNLATQAATPTVSGPAAAPESTINPALATDLQVLLDDIIANTNIPGIVMSVRLPDGTTWEGASGEADFRADVLMEPQTPVRIGSLSKMFTAVVVLQLIEEGKIELDAPIERWLPDLLPAGERTTVRHLLQHTTGLYDYLEDRRYVGEAFRDPNRQWEPRELVDYANQFPSLFAPGNRWDYSNTNYVVLAMLVEQVTGNSLANELSTRVFEPLGLEQTYFIPTDTVPVPQAHGYSELVDITAVSLGFAYGTANIVTTAADLRRFGEGLFVGDLLTEESKALMQTFISGRGQYGMPQLEYGLGLMRNMLDIGSVPESTGRSPEAGRVIGHIGGFGGFRAALWYSPETEMLIAFSANQAMIDPNDISSEVLALLLAYEEP